MNAIIADIFGTLKLNPKYAINVGPKIGTKVRSITHCTQSQLKRYLHLITLTHCRKMKSKMLSALQRS